MARKSLKSPPPVEPSQFSCVWNFSGMFDHHHHGRPNRKLLSDDSHGSKAFPGARHTRSQVRMINFDEQLRSINIESKKKTAIVNRSIEGKETSSSDHTRKNDTTEISFWKKIKSRYENPKKKNKNPSFIDKIVVLKPIQRVVECPVDVGCRFMYLHPHHTSTSKQQTVKNNNLSFNDVTKKLKNEKKLKKVQKTSGNVTKTKKMSIISSSKQRESEVFVEAKRHLAERLRQVEKGEDLSSKQVSRTLERILLSSPIHGSMASSSCESEGTHLVPRSEKTWGGSSLLNHNDGSSASGSLEITDSNDFLQRDSEFSTPGSGQELLLNISSPKPESISKSETTGNDQFRENPSPVSVLESFFSDNISSPTSTIESIELQIQPNRLDFEEHSSQTSSPPHQKTNLNTLIEDRVLISAHVNTIYQAYESNWDEFLLTDYPLESSYDHKLFRDCVKEVLVSLNLPWMMFVESKIRDFSFEKDVVNEVMERVEWHNGRPVGPRTLDQLVGRDIAKSGKWVDVKSDQNDIVFEVVDDTLQELILEVIFEILV